MDKKISLSPLSFEDALKKTMEVKLPNKKKASKKKPNKKQ